MSVLIQCSKHIRTAYNLSRNRISNTLIPNSSSHTFPSSFSGINNGSPPKYHRNINILPNRSFFSSTIQYMSSGNQVDVHIKKIDYELRRTGRISKREIESILNEIKRSKTITPSQSLMIIRCCGNLVPDELPENRSALVQKIWETLNNLKVPLDISHYNTLLKVYLENNYQFSPTEFLENLEKQSISPNRVTFQHLISSYCQNGDIVGASRILEYMRDKQLPINTIVFNALVMGHSQNGDMESAEGVLNVMKESDLEPTSDTYTLLASGYARKGDITKISEIFSICESKELFLSNKDYLDIVYTLAINGHEDKIDQITSLIPKTAGYNQDAINSIYKLVLMGKEEAAFKVFDTMTTPLKIDGTSPPVGRFLIGHLTKVQSSLENIIKFCSKLVSEGKNAKAFEIAAELALKKGSVDIALGMFEYLKKNDQPIRQHYFWPLFVAKNKQNDLEGLKNILDVMIKKYELSPTVDTLRFYILPTMVNNNLSGTQIINNLHYIGVPTGTSTHALVLHFLVTKQIRLAADIAATHRAFFNPNVMRRPLINAFVTSNDITSLIVILQQICNGLSRFSLITSSEAAKQTTEKFVSTISEDQIVEMREFLGLVLNGIVRDLNKNTGVVPIMQELLEKMYEKGLGINSNAAEQIQNHFQGKLTFEISSLLENLTDSNLVPKTELGVKPGFYTFATADETTLEKIIKKSELSGESKYGPKRQLLNLYCKNNSFEKAIALKDKLLAEGFKFQTGTMVLLLDLYLINNHLAEAKEILQQLKTEDADFVLDKYKVIHMALAIVETESVENAIEFLSTSKPTKEIGEFVSFQHSNSCWKLLNIVAETGNVENLQKIFDLLVNNNYISVTNVLLGPFIKVHLINNNVKAALEKFEWCCKTYRCTPMKNELAMKFIEAEDASSLQTLTDLSTTVHGEVNSLYDLIFSFIDCGRVKQARKILETPGLQIRQNRINAICAKYGSLGAEQSLIHLLDITKDSSFDRSNIFNELIKLYSEKNKVEEAMALWTQIQEENSQPTDHFMWTLSELLKVNNLEVPFTVKKPITTIVSSVPSDVLKNLFSQFELSITNDDVTQALKLHKIIHSKGFKINSQKESQLIELLIQKNKLDEAFKIAQEMFNNSRPISKNILNFLTMKLSEVGDLESLEYLNGKLSKNLKNKLTLNNKIFSAYQMKGNVNELLTLLETRIDENLNNEQELSRILKDVPGGNLVSILRNDSSLLPTIERLNAKVLKHGQTIFSNSLWSYFMLNKNFDRAADISKDLENTKVLQFRHLLTEIRSNHNIELGQKFIEILPIFKEINQNQSIGLAYSAMIDSYIKQENIDEASNLLDKALERITIQDLNISAVLRLRQSLVTQGKVFKHNISTLKQNKSTSKNPELHSDSDSSDSSDDEKVARKLV